jgi:hypothetical protein
MVTKGRILTISRIGMLATMVAIDRKENNHSGEFQFFRKLTHIGM